MILLKRSINRRSKMAGLRLSSTIGAAVGTKSCSFYGHSPNPSALANSTDLKALHFPFAEAVLLAQSCILRVRNLRFEIPASRSKVIRPKEGREGEVTT